MEGAKATALFETTALAGIQFGNVVMIAIGIVFIVLAIAKHYEFDKNARWKDLPAYVQQVFLYGSGEDEIAFRYDALRSPFTPLRRHKAIRRPGSPRTG